MMMVVAIGASRCGARLGVLCEPFLARRIEAVRRAGVGFDLDVAAARTASLHEGDATLVGDLLVCGAVGALVRDDIRTYSPSPGSRVDGSDKLTRRAHRREHNDVLRAASVRDVMKRSQVVPVAGGDSLGLS